MCVPNLRSALVVVVGKLDIIFVTEFALGYSVKILDAIDLGDSDVP